MSAVQTLNPKAQVVQRAQAFQGNLAAAKGLQEVLKTNLGPRGTLKMLVGGAGQLKLTKDGNVLLKEMQIQHPTAAMIARAATAQDEIVGDGTTSNVLFVGELLRQAEKLMTEGIHPRIVVQGYELARAKALELLEAFKVSKETVDRETLINVARTSLRSKLSQELADQFTEIVVDAVLSIRKENGIDLHMVEIMHMRHQHASDSRLVKGLVLDHGSRHQDMPAELKSCFILTCNVNLEYEKTEVNSQFCFSNANQREKLFKSERKFVDDKVLKIIELKNRVCTQGQGFVVINQKGIDPVSLDLLAHENIIALRRAKRRNMERLTLACGGNAVNSVEDLSVSDLGKADLVYEQQLGEEKFTFVEGVPNTLSCTILVKGPDDHTINQIKDAIRDGLRSVKNTLLDKSFVPGAGAFEISTCVKLKEYAKTVSGKPRRGIEAFADALMVIPRTLAENSGLDAQDCLLKLQEAFEKAQKPVGLDLENGDAISPEAQGILDNAVVKRQFLNLAPVLAQQLLLVDEVIKAGQQIRKNEE